MANKISIKTGTPVEGNDFYGREKELQYAWDVHILKGTSLLLSAPRRVGKSSFSKKMLRLAQENGWKTLYLDLQGIGTESEFVKLFKDEIQKEEWWKKEISTENPIIRFLKNKKLQNETGNIILKIFKTIRELKAQNNTNSTINEIWRNDTYGRIKQLIECSGNILIVIDELTLFLDHLIKQENGKEKVEFFLEWLRKFRQISGTKVRWILCSSVGIENFASMHQLSKHLNDVHSFKLEAFTEDEAKEFISRLDVDEKVQFTEEHIQYILDKLGWYLPFFIQILVEKINFLVYVEKKQFSNDTIDEAYNRLLTENRKDFIAWDERLKYYYEFEDDARKILKLCALHTGESRENLLANLVAKKSDTDIDKIETNLSQLLAMLKNDGYLAEHNGKYIFRSPLLRDFWYNRFIL